MFEGNRLQYYIVALAALCLIGLAWVTEPTTISTTKTDPKYDCPYKTYEVGSNSSGGFELKIRRDSAACANHETTKNDSSKTERFPESVAEMDLLEQRKMVHWTACIGGFTAIGLGLLYTTFDATRQAVIDARAIGKAQSRAILNFTQHRIELDELFFGGDCLHSENSKFRIPLIFKIENIGRSNAYDVNIECRGYLTENSRRAEDLIEDNSGWSDWKSVSYGFVPAGTQRLGRHAPLLEFICHRTTAPPEQIRQGATQCMILVEWRVSYQDELTRGEVEKYITFASRIFYLSTPDNDHQVAGRDYAT